MNYVIVLSGGIGTRVGVSIPKQYIEVKGKPIIEYCVKEFQQNQFVDQIIVVVSDEWIQYVSEKLKKYSKVAGYAFAGNSRQKSICNGLNYICENMSIKDDDIVLIHDAARPNLTQNLINNCFNNVSDGYDGVLPVLPVKDTLYYSVNGKNISNLLDRDKIYAGQSPEAFLLKKYYDINKNLLDSELDSIKGSSEIAFKKGLKVKIISGEEKNYKITTKLDLQKFIEQEGR